MRFAAMHTHGESIAEALAVRVELARELLAVHSGPVTAECARELRDRDVGAALDDGVRHGQPGVRDRRGDAWPAPIVDVRPGGNAGGRERPIGREADAIRDRRARTDRPRGPGAVAGLHDEATARVGHEERRVVRLVTIRLAGTALSELFDHRRQDVEGLVGRACSFETEPDDIHSQEGGRVVARSIDRPDLLVAYRDAVLVDAVFGAPQPRRLRAEERVRAVVRDREVLRVQRCGVCRPARVPPDDLGLVRVPVGVLGEQHSGVGADAQRVAHSA
jgi:hypothetical protein